MMYLSGFYLKTQEELPSGVCRYFTKVFPAQNAGKTLWHYLEVLLKFDVLLRNLFLGYAHVAAAKDIGILIDEDKLLYLHLFRHVIVGSAVPFRTWGILVIALPEVFKVIELRFAFGYALAIFGEGADGAPAVRVGPCSHASLAAGVDYSFIDQPALLAAMTAKSDKSP